LQTYPITPANHLSRNVMTAEPHAFRDTSHREFVTPEPKEQQMYMVAVPLQGGEPGCEGAACQ